MPDGVPRDIEERLRRCGQSQLLKWWPELDAAQRQRLLSQLEAIDFSLVSELTNRAREKSAAGLADDDHPTENLAERAGSPLNLVRLPTSPAEVEERRAAGKVGEELLSQGKVGAVVVAGGQGTRLGFDRPKGLFPIGPVSGRSLFQLFAEQLIARSQRAGVVIPYFVMTSHATHAETVDFFATNKFFGLNPGDVFFFQQGTMPAVCSRTGDILLAEKDSVALSPDGHGGMLAALKTGGLFEEMRGRGIECLFYHQVDNPAGILCDPVFLGLHVLRQSDFSTKVVAKIAPDEPMGVIAGVEKTNRIIEYSDLSADLQTKTDADGKLWFWAGNTAIHIFDREFLERMANDPETTPFHIAQKTAGFIGETGEIEQPADKNAWKFERFIFDILPLAANPLVLEVDRSREFLPVKNADGSDSPESSRAGLIRIYHSWLREAGTEIDANIPVEISPLTALEAEDLQRADSVPARIDRPTVIGPQ